MSRSHSFILVFLGCLVIALPAGCVKRVYEAPGLTPGSTLAVGSDMRVETFQVDDWEVRVFQIPLTEGNRRRYQFIVLRRGVYDHNYLLQQLEDGTWALLERRSDGISTTRKTYPVEPDYAAVRAEVEGLLRGGN